MAARSTMMVLLLTASLATASGDDSSLHERIAKLERLLGENTQRLDDVGRRLLGPQKSIYEAPTSSLGYSSEQSLDGALEHVWFLLCGALVFFISAGLAMVKAGSSRVTTVQHVFLLCLWDLCIGTMAWWIVGYSFAYSGPNAIYKENSFIGYEQFAGHMFTRERASDGQVEPSFHIVKWFSTWAVSTVATSIVNGGVAERNFIGYSIHSLLFASVIYPVVVAWSYGGGWLRYVNAPGFQDYAGSGIVHLTGGVSALVGAALSGPRKGRWDAQSWKDRIRDLPEHLIPHSQPLVILGTLMAWFGWYGLTCSGPVAMHGNVYGSFLIAQIAMNTTISAAASGIMAFLVQLVIKRKNDVSGMCNGVLAGLVSICAGCASVDCGSALAIGVAAGIIYPLVSALLKICRIDDPVDAFAVHGACGCWGLLSAALMDWGRGFRTVHGMFGFNCYLNSTATDCWEDGQWAAGVNLLLANLAEIGSIIAWAGGLSAVIFGILRALRLLRHTEEAEESGIDSKWHVPVKAYNFGIPTSADFCLNSI